MFHLAVYPQYLALCQDLTYFIHICYLMEQPEVVPLVSFQLYPLKNCSDGHLCTKLSVYISDHFLGLREDELLDSQVWNILHLLSCFIRILFQFPFLPAMCESSHLITSPLELNMFMFKSLLIFSH